MRLSQLKINASNRFVWANALLLVFLVLTGQADAFSILLAYFMETIVIGIIQMCKLWLTNHKGLKDVDIANTPKMKGGFLILFFAFHYGFFVAVQSVFMFGFFEIEFDEIASAFNLIENYLFAINYKGTLWALGAILFFNLSEFYSYFWLPRRFERVSPNKLFFKPYVRIFVQQFAVILGGFFIFLSEAGIGAAIVLIVVRTYVDLYRASLRGDSAALDRLAKRLSKDPSQLEKVRESLELFAD